MAKKVLVVDDEKLIVKGIRFSLEQDGMEVDCAYDGEEALSMAKEKEYDMILLDLMLPKLDGLSVCQQIREFSNVPIVMLTAKGEDMDKILGLEYGADDYITKPFNILEVKARIKAIMRRAARQEPKEEKAKDALLKDHTRYNADDHKNHRDAEAQTPQKLPFFFVFKPGNSNQLPTLCERTSVHLDFSRSFRADGGYVHLRCARRPGTHSPRQCSAGSLCCTPCSD